jgi:transposase
VSRLLEECGHEVLVANPSKLQLVYKNPTKDDRVDAQCLARVARLDPKLLWPIHHRGSQTQADLEVIRARDALVSARTQLINHVRGAVKSLGARLPRTSTESFPKKVAEHIPEPVRQTLTPVLEMIRGLTERIRDSDRKIDALVTDRYPAARLVQQVTGVGALTALAYVLILEDPNRFKSSRAVGSYLGLTPGRDQSGDSDPQLRITKAGDMLLRKLLVGSAQYIMGPFGPDCDSKRKGLALAARGGKNAKKRAVVAVARKLAVLLHHLWITAEVYEPLHNSEATETTKA